MYNYHPCSPVCCNNFYTTYPGYLSQDNQGTNEAAPLLPTQDGTFQHARLANLLASLSRKVEDREINPDLIKAKIDNFMQNHTLSGDISPRVKNLVKGARCVLQSALNTKETANVDSAYTIIATILQEAANVAGRFIQKRVLKDQNS